MAFSLSVRLPFAEYRGQQSGISKKTGLPWCSLIFELPDTSQIQASVPSDILSEVNYLGLTKGDMCQIDIRAVAQSDGNSYVKLTSVPEIVDMEG